jgi:hypothetical protein
MLLPRAKVAKYAKVNFAPVARGNQSHARNSAAC